MSHVPRRPALGLAPALRYRPGSDVWPFRSLLGHDATGNGREATRRARQPRPGIGQDAYGTLRLYARRRGVRCRLTTPRQMTARQA